MFKDIIENVKSNGLKYITPKRAYIWFRSKVRKITGYRLSEKDTLLFSEVLVYKSLTCPDCAAAGKCKICKCPIPELFNAMEVGCSDGKFPAFKEGIKWKLFFKSLVKRDWKTMKGSLKQKRWQDSWIEYKKKSGIFINLLFLK